MTVAQSAPLTSREQTDRLRSKGVTFDSTIRPVLPPGGGHQRTVSTQFIGGSRDDSPAGRCSQPRPHFTNGGSSSGVTRSFRPVPRGLSRWIRTAVVQHDNGIQNLHSEWIGGFHTSDPVADLRGSDVLAGSLDRCQRAPASVPALTRSLLTAARSPTMGCRLGLVSGGDSVSPSLSTPGQVNLIVTAMPEPGTLGLGLACTLLLGHRNRRRRS